MKQKKSIPFKTPLPLGHALALLLLAAWPFRSAMAQDTQPPQQAVAVGEQVPDVTLSSMINYPKTSAKLSDFRGKLLILDFWATWCGSCLVAMPKMEELQQAFGDSIQILAVTTQGPEIVLPFKEKNPILRRTSLPIVMGNENLKELFPHRSIPHLVWIDPEGRLLTQTGTFDANPTTVRNLLRKKEGNFRDSKKDNMAFDALKPLFLNGNGGSPFPLQRSILTPYAQGLGNRSGFIKSDSTARLFHVNSSVGKLYTTAAELPSYFPMKQVLYESERARRYQVTDPVLDKEEKNFCYELLLPIAQAGEAHTIMRQDLERHFGLQAEVQQRKTDCWVLTRRKGASLPITAGGKQENNLNDPATPVKFLQNEPVSKLVFLLDKSLPTLPVIDRTGITAHLDMQLEGELQDVDQLNGQLAAYGLKLEKKKLPLKVLVIR